MASSTSIAGVDVVGQRERSAIIGEKNKVRAISPEKSFLDNRMDIMPATPAWHVINISEDSVAVRCLLKKYQI